MKLEEKEKAMKANINVSNDMNAGTSGVMKFSQNFSISIHVMTILKIWKISKMFLSHFFNFVLLDVFVWAIFSQ